MKQLNKMINEAMDILREKDVEMGAMDSNFNPVNHILSAEDNRKCWEYLAKTYVMNMMKLIADLNSFDLYKKLISDERFFVGWLNFLQAVENVVRYGQKNQGIEDIVNHSGISRETLVKFLD